MGDGSRTPERVLFGAAYYTEYQPNDRLKEDLDLMAEAGFSVIRVGESVWSTWEPEDGRFELDWLQPVLDGAHERRISVVLGTPTYAVPPWLARTYPEITGEDGTGHRMGWGARQEVDYTHAAFRFHAERIIRAVISRYADHPAVIGFQVDNEPGLHLFHNHNVFQRFVDHLRHRYGTVEALNEAWGLVYWSHRLSDWSDLWTPDNNAQPQYDVAWREFQGSLTTEFIGWQADIVREYASSSQFVTTCIAYERPAIDDEQVSRTLDVTSGNAYYDMQDGLLLPDGDRARQLWRTRGVWSLNLTADRMYASKQAPFLVTETNASSIGFPWSNKPAYDGQWRQAGWALVARGAEMIEYWHWHTLHFGAETYWGGVLPHNQRPGRTYREIAQLGAEFAAAGKRVVGLTPQADVAFLYSTPSKWLMEKYPPLAGPDGEAHERAWHEIFDAFYKGAFDAGLQARIVHVPQLLEGTGLEPPQTPAEFARTNPILVAVGIYLTDDRLLRWLGEYAAAGGHLVLGPRTAYADTEGRARTDIAPALLADRAGVWYDEFSNLEYDVPVVGEVLQGAGTHWIDGLVVDGAEVLATYAHPHFAQWPAVTTSTAGDGRITYVGTVPDDALARALFVLISPVPDTWGPLPDSVTVRTAVDRAGRRLHFIHNWSWEPCELTAPSDLLDLLTKTPIGLGDPIRLEPWDVRVISE
ncbi:beta-galactosidase [Kribbella sp. NPDC006257]|uniref:beta-galactosidase n=1 Tax=Kribbella sp. NPDC006257 TaxID=3156738 RepID=UPI00339EADBA